MDHGSAVTAAEEFLNPGADLVDEDDVGGLLALPEAVKHLLGRLERTRGRGRRGTGAAVEQVRGARVHAGEVLVEAALAVEDGAVVAALLHKAHGGFLDDLGLDRADQGAEIVDGVVQGHGEREHNLRHHHAGRVGHEVHEPLVALGDAPGDAEHVIQALHAGGAHEEANAVDVAVAVGLLRVEAEVLGREEELLEDGRLSEAVAALGLLARGDRRAALGGSPEVRGYLHDVAEAGDAHGVANADLDLALAIRGDGVHPHRVRAARRGRLAGHLKPRAVGNRELGHREGHLECVCVGVFAYETLTMESPRGNRRPPRLTRLVPVLRTRRGRSALARRSRVCGVTTRDDCGSRG